MKKIRFSTVVTALVIAAAAIMFTGCGSSDSSSVEQYDYTGFVMGTVLSETTSQRMWRRNFPIRKTG